MTSKASIKASSGPTTDVRQAAKNCFPGWSLGAIKLRFLFRQQARRHKAALAPFLQPRPDSALADVMAQRPETVGAVLWPYLCAGWDTKERLTRIAAHYDIIDSLGPPWHFPPNMQLELADLTENYPELRLVIDQPKWFMREGGVVLNLFKGNFRTFSLAFSFYQTPDGRLQAIVGSLQGRNQEGALDLYRDLTKALHGLRPRDMLFEVFRMICRAVNVDEILGVTQAHRHHQHPYFKIHEDLSPDYDAIWQERDGTMLNAQFFMLEVNPPQRELETIKPKKRSLYRKRFAFLEGLEAKIAQDLPNLKPISFVDT